MLPLTVPSSGDEAALPPSYTYTKSQHDSVSRRSNRSRIRALALGAVIRQAQSRLGSYRDAVAEPSVTVCSANVAVSSTVPEHVPSHSV